MSLNPNKEDSDVCFWGKLVCHLHSSCVYTVLVVSYNLVVCHVVFLERPSLLLFPEKVVTKGVVTQSVC